MVIAPVTVKVQDENNYMFKYIGILPFLFLAKYDEAFIKHMYNII